MNISTRVLSAAIGAALLSGVALVQAAPATAVATSAKTAFIKSMVSPAQKSQRQFGVPASVSIAQAIVDSEWGTSSPAKEAKNYFNTKCSSSSMTASQFAKLADAQLGKPYVLGAEAALTQTNPPKFDCSELVEWLFGRSGNPITDLAAAQYNVTKAVPKGSSPKVGDLVFLRNNPARSNGIGHVAVLTRKLSSGDWRIIEARGRAYGVVATTLSYWKQRSYYAGLRRYSKLVFASSEGATPSAAGRYQSGCVTIASTKYAKFSSASDSFAAHAAAVTGDSAYAGARAAIGNREAYIAAIAKIEHPKDAAEYADKLNSVIAGYNLNDYDVVPFDLVLVSGNKGAKVTALQYLLQAEGGSVSANGSYDSKTVSAVKKYQSAKGLTKDGEAGPITLSALFPSLSTKATGARVSALHTLLTTVGYRPSTGSTFGAETLAAVKDLQQAAGRTPTGVVDKSTWALLFMALDPAPAPTVSGEPEVTETLTAKVAKWGPGSVSLSYQWYRDGAAISGATRSEYTLQAADQNKAITVVVSGARAGYTSVRRVSSSVGPVSPTDLVATPTPKVSGTPVVDEVLTAQPGTWAPAPVVLKYQWYRGTTAIPDATQATYRLQAADVDAKLKVAVTGSRAGYEAVTTTSAVTGAVAKGKISPAVPKISGSAKVGETLTAVPGAWEPASVTMAYQWYRGTKAIAKANQKTYELTADDAGATISVRVTADKAGFTAVSKTSATTAKVAGPGRIVATTPKVSGTAKVGRTLKVVVGAWTPEKVTLGYRWYRSGKSIKGATKATYKLTAADKGKTLTVRVSGRKTGYTTVVVAAAGVKVK